MNRPASVERLIEVIKKMPSVGPKMAERLSYYILKMPEDEVGQLLTVIQKARQIIKSCSFCYNLSEQDPCPICSDISREKHILCVVETPQDLMSVSKVKEYKGLYFVLGGALSPLEAIGPNDIRIDKLIKRLKNGIIS